MSILVDENTKVIVQGITGRDGSFHAFQMREYGTEVVGGVTPGKGGQKVDGIPVFDSVAEAAAETGANASAIFVPVAFAVDAIYEALDAGLELIVVVTEGIPANEMLKLHAYTQGRPARVIGPNCPGVISPGKCKVGIMPGHIHTPGAVGVVSRSGTLTYEVVHQLTLQGLGQSTCVGIGGDPMPGTNFLDVLRLFRDDPQTEAVVLIGEIGGRDEEVAAEYIAEELGKPGVAFVAGRTAPPGKRMGHAGAIVTGGEGTAADKVAAFEAAGILVGQSPRHVAELMKERLGRVAGGQ